MIDVALLIVNQSLSRKENRGGFVKTTNYNPPILTKLPKTNIETAIRVTKKMMK